MYFRYIKLIMGILINLPFSLKKITDLKRYLVKNKIHTIKLGA